MLGIIVAFMIPAAEIWPPIHNIVVVTSPIGDHAPPALAERTIMPTNNKRITLFRISFRVSETITMVVVRLSSTADKKKVTIQMIHNNFFGSLVLILSVTNLNP